MKAGHNPDRIESLTQVPKVYKFIDNLLSKKVVARELRIFDLLFAKRKDHSLAVTFPKLKFLKEYKLAIFIPSDKKVFYEYEGEEIHAQIAKRNNLRTEIKLGSSLPYMSGDAFVLRGKQNITVLRLDYLYDDKRQQVSSKNGLIMSLPTKDSIIALRRAGILLMDLSFNWLVESDEDPRGFTSVKSGLIEITVLELHRLTKKHYSYK